MRAYLAAALALAGCNAAPGNDSAPVAADQSEAAPPSPSPAVVHGQTSTLSGQTSGLTGSVTDFRVTETASATIVALATDTLFAFDKADLEPNAVSNLERTAELIRAAPPGMIAVNGHTDAKGEDAYNQKLSERRAEAVAGWLRKQSDLSGWTFTTAGKGETAPAAPNVRPDGSDDPEGRARNRRVEIVIPKG